MRSLRFYDRPCCGTRFAETRLHRLKCGHLVCTSLWSSTSTLCSSNCLSPHRPVPFSARFALLPACLCPKCYEEDLYGQLQNFKLEVQRVMRSRGQDEFTVLSELKMKYESGGKRYKGEYNRWYDLELGFVSYVDICKESYSWTKKDEKKRGCKSVD